MPSDKPPPITNPVAKPPGTPGDKPEADKAASGVPVRSLGDFEVDPDKIAAVLGVPGVEMP